MIQCIWTNHAKYKMAFYRLSESRIRSVIHSPLRTEEGIAPNTIAVMQPTSSVGYGNNKKWKNEIWVMYITKDNKSKRIDKFKEIKNLINNKRKIKIISAWRYPGVTKPKEGFPEEINEEIFEALSTF